MNRPRRSAAMIVLAAVVLGTPLLILAGVPVPEIQQGQGSACVEDTEFMRRNHMNLLLHQRDETVLQGMRGEQHSLKECVSCHAIDGADSLPLTAASPQHFCRSCHDYAAVKIDCFGCHASRPEVVVAAGAEE